VANPQPDQFTRISNEILEVIPTFKFNGTQLRIILVILRYTYGFGRKEHELSVSFLSEATGIDKRWLRREVNNLIEKQVIKVVREATFSQPRILGFNKDYDQWQIPRSVQNTPQCTKEPERTNSPSPQGVNSPSPQGVNSPPKKEIFKEKFKENTTTTSLGVSQEEIQILNVLRSVDNYPFDYEKDLKMIRSFTLDYPELNILHEVKKWSNYKLDNPLKNKSSPRLQLRNWMDKALEFLSKNTKGVNIRGSPEVRTAEKTREPPKKQGKYRAVNEPG